jgi:hypothetical protein
MRGVQSGNGKGWHPFDFGVDSILTGWAGPIPKANYLAWYPMNEGTGTEFFDKISGNNATIQSSGGPYGSWISGAFNWNGTVGGAATALNAGPTNFSGMTPFSVSFWQKSTLNNSSGTLLTNISNFSTFQGLLIQNDNGVLDFQLIGSNSGQIWLETGTILNQGTNYHIVITYTGSQLAAGVLIYVDGVSVTYSVVQNGLTLTAASGTPIEIGGWTGESEFFTGSIQDVRFFNTVLSQTQITYLYNGGPK